MQDDKLFGILAKCALGYRQIAASLKATYIPAPGDVLPEIKALLSMADHIDRAVSLGLRSRAPDDLEDLIFRASQIGRGFNATPRGPGPLARDAIGLYHALSALRETTSGAGDPMNWPLPAMVQIGPVRFGQGSRLGALVNSARRWREMASALSSHEVKGDETIAAEILRETATDDMGRQVVRSAAQAPNTPDLVEILRSLEARATPAPWEVERAHDADAEFGSGDDTSSGFDNCEMHDAEGRSLFGSENAALKAIVDDRDDDGGRAWDQVAARNFEFLAEVRNRFPEILDRLQRENDAMVALNEWLDLTKFVQDEAMGAPGQHRATALRETLEHEREVSNKLRDRVADLEARLAVQWKQEVELTIHDVPSIRGGTNGFPFVMVETGGIRPTGSVKVIFESASGFRSMLARMMEVRDTYFPEGAGQ